MDVDTLHSIGELARRTGLTVKAIRFYSDSGIVPPAARSPAGYRRYGSDAVARLDLVRTLRALGLDLATIRKVVDRQVSLPEVATTHAAALAAQIRVLRLRHAALMALAQRGWAAEERDLMHVAVASEDEHRGLVDEFLDAVFGGPRVDPAFPGIRRSMTPELSDDPSAEEAAAWVELAELLRNPDFRAGMRRMAQEYADERAEGDTMVRRDVVTVVHDHAREARAAGIDPAAPDAEPTIAAVIGYWAHLVGRPDDLDLRRRLLARLETANDPRRERYLRLLGVINGWPAGQSLAPELDWFIRALRARLP